MSSFGNIRRLTQLASSPAVVNGVVYVGSYDHNVYALNAANGAKLWSYATGDLVTSSPAVADDVVYVDSKDGNVYALNANNGIRLWKYATGDPFSSSPIVAGGVVYVGSSNDVLYGSTNNFLYALNANNGKQIWNYTVQGDYPVFSWSPSIDNGILFSGLSYDEGQVYALRVSSSLSNALPIAIGWIVVAVIVIAIVSLLIFRRHRNATPPPKGRSTKRYLILVIIAVAIIIIIIFGFVLPLSRFQGIPVTKSPTPTPTAMPTITPSPSPTIALKVSSVVTVSGLVNSIAIGYLPRQIRFTDLNSTFLANYTAPVSGKFLYSILVPNNSYYTVSVAGDSGTFVVFGQFFIDVPAGSTSITQNIAPPANS